MSDKSAKAIRREYPRKLSRQILVFCILFVGLLCTGITVVSYRMYKEDMIGRYESYETVILNLALSSADAEGLREAICTNTRNEAYEKLSDKFNRYLSNSTLQYIYAIYFKENDDNMYYVVNGYDELMNAEEIHGLGDLPTEGDFTEDMVEKLRTASEQNHKKVQFIVAKDVHHTLLLTAYIPLLDENGDTVCVFCADILMEDIQVRLEHFVKYVAIGVIVLGLVILTLFIIILNGRVVSPIIRLADSTRHFITQHEDEKPGELVFREVPIHSRDEIQLLSDSMNYMVKQLEEYMVNVSNYAVEQERVNTQFAVVQKLKENLFPFQFPAFQERTDFDIYAHIEYSKITSGDFYDFFLVDSSHLCFFTGTASGNGVTTTMIAILTTIYMENYARLGYLPNRILGETNNRLSENNSGEITVNIFLGVIDLVTGELIYSQVGDSSALIKRSGQEAAMLETPSGFSLGSLENMVYTQQKVSMKQGEALLLYTQGVPKRRDKKGYEFTDDYVKQTLNHLMQEEYALDRIADGLYEELEHYSDGGVAESDETVLLFRYLGN